MAEDRTPEVTHFHEAAVWTGASDAERNSWLEARKKMVTASNVAALLGLDPRQDAIDVYANTLATPTTEQELPIWDPRVWGKALERSIAETAARCYRWELRMGGYLLQSRQYPFLGATLDAEIVPGGTDTWLTYEGKVVSQFLLRDWDEETGMPPEHVFCQKQAQLIVTGAPAGVVFALIGGNRPCRIDVTPDPDFRSLIIETAQEFMERVARMDPPPATYRSKSALQKLYPKESGAVIQLDREALEWSRELEEVASIRKAHQEREELLKNNIRKALGNASYGFLPEATPDGMALWKCTTTEVAAHTVAASSYRAPRMLKHVPKGIAPPGATGTNPGELPPHQPLPTGLEELTPANEFASGEPRLITVKGRRGRR